MLEGIRKAKNLSDVARCLGFTPKGLSYVLYILPSDERYRTFTIPKKAGGTRTIQAPKAPLANVQKRLADNLYQCVAELQEKKKRLWAASHGFQKQKGIISNAELHKCRRYVFNVDIENFFGSINFGRVRGYFIHDKSFSLEADVATIIAQIVCHENALPQGSPCSPIISNFIGNILDLRLLALARDSRCTYTRYADDLTFSTNKKHFPREIAENYNGSNWEVGKVLRHEIERSGFNLNDSKTGMSLKQSRQMVTGLVVNAKLNIKQEYYRYVRAMCHRLFKTGKYHHPLADSSETADNLSRLEGMMSHIYFVKSHRKRLEKIRNERLQKVSNKKSERAAKRHKARIKQQAKVSREEQVPTAFEELYEQFLFYKNFVAPTAPTIITEGSSDTFYLKHAIRKSVGEFPFLAEKQDGKVRRLVNFLKPSKTTKSVLNLEDGVGGQCAFIARYIDSLKHYEHKPMKYPVIVVCDNDNAAAGIFSEFTASDGVDSHIRLIRPFYFIAENLYVVKLPEGNPPAIMTIERLFKPETLAEKYNEKSFNPDKMEADETEYGKAEFLSEVVRPNWKHIDFSGFNSLLFRIEQCIQHYQGR